MLLVNYNKNVEYKDLKDMRHPIKDGRLLTMYDHKDLPTAMDLIKSDF